MGKYIQLFTGDHGSQRRTGCDLVLVVHSLKFVLRNIIWKDETKYNHLYLFKI